ncbi:MAG: hypothetical protein ABIJ81_01655 [Patescibacteria group bacterium]
MMFKFFATIKKIPPTLLYKLVPIVIILAILVALGWSVIFLYLNFYQTLTQAEEVSILRSQVSLRTINLKLYDQVFSALAHKKEFDAEKLKNLNNPFARKSTRASTPLTDH